MLKPIKRLGQNFLQDPNTIRRIVDALDAEAGDAVIEIGPGAGALTGLLAEKYSRFIAIEIDDRAADLLEDELPEVSIIRQDILESNWAILAEKLDTDRLYVIGNLPYYITSQIIFSLLDASPLIEEAVIMMQYEVAERLVAVPRTKSYGILSVVVQLACEVEILFPVSKNVFFPKPDVRSAMVKLRFPEQKPDASGDPAFLRTLVRTAFNQRRKTLRNSLSRILTDTMPALPDELSGKRAEELAPSEFVDLADYLLAHPD